MANSCAFHRSATWLALVIIIIISVVAVHVADAGGQGECPPFSCGDLHNISYPFRRPGDPPECGAQAYQLVCSRSKATIRINTGTYFVTSINYTDRSFWVVDAKLDMDSSCPLPRWDQLPYSDYGSVLEIGPHHYRDLATAGNWACFVNCSRVITNNSWYKPVNCLSVNGWFVYASIFECVVEYLEPSCAYLAMTPYGNRYGWDLQRENASYADIIELVKQGFSVRFPQDYYYYDHYHYNASWVFKTCLNKSTRYFHEQLFGTSILKWTRAFFWSEFTFQQCVDSYSYFPDKATQWFDIAVPFATNIIKLHVVRRFVLSAVAVLIFLAHRYWKTRITVDAVEKFLRMQQMLGPTRYAYTDITAITSHFRDKLGQGGYGSVYKGVLLPGNVQVAVKMLGNSNCNGDEFISEVSTIGRIHHINVVRLVGFCAEEMRRALVYEFMPHGSLDKYIFSSERSFSWDKLNEIALGIARGIDYLHGGCDMQILHFDIKPHNILLDSNFVPKVADFGLAKLYPRDKSFVPASALRGTIGYIAPEMVSRSFGVISSKSDVYSFGMLLLEMAGGRRNADQNAANSSQAYYPSWVYDRLAEQEVGEISAAADMHELERKLCVVGLRCIQMKPQDRPTMSEVIEMLESGADGLQMPSRPFFCDDDHITVADSYHFSSELTAISEEDE
ncbi:rust resistance kinase Lr10-like [Phragmites australis]|uniref:rust resistance kinase Lr10-like n=1 Tax=Phragmites australis TaxID=29695 RepID=UPI002D7729C4|nr:rust resistance kinase Lr10-like [Phragmites australis]